MVKAQVKVAFKTRDGKPVIVNTSMQGTVPPLFVFTAIEPPKHNLISLKFRYSDSKADKD